MKRLTLVACLAVGAAGLAAVAADPEIAWREKLRTVVTTNGLAVATDTNAVTVASARTPAYAGQLLFGGAGAGTNGVWVAKGTATNDWVQIEP